MTVYASTRFFQIIHLTADPPQNRFPAAGDLK